MWSTPGVLFRTIYTAYNETSPQGGPNGNPEAHYRIQREGQIPHSGSRMDHHRLRRDGVFPARKAKWKEGLDQLEPTEVLTTKRVRKDSLFRKIYTPYNGTPTNPRGVIMRKNKSEKLEVKESPKRIRLFLTRTVKGTVMVVGGVLIGYGIATVRRSDSV